MSNKEINYKQIKEWIVSYQKETCPKKKKQILTLIVMTCYPLIKNLSYGLARRSTDPIEDILQVGTIGLIKAINHYNKSYNNIQTYIKISIVGEIKHYLRDKVQSIKPPRFLLELSYRINKLNAENLEKAGIEYSKNQLAKKLKTTENIINEVVDFERRKIISLDEIQFSDDGKTIEENLTYDSSDDDEYTLKENKILLKKLINKLPTNLRIIIKGVYFDNICQKDIATILNTTQSYISKLQKKALKMLFEMITNKEG